MPGPGLAVLLVHCHLQEKSNCPNLLEFCWVEMLSLPQKALTNSIKALRCISIAQIINYLEQRHMLTAQTMRTLLQVC